MRFFLILVLAMLTLTAPAQKKKKDFSMMTPTELVSSLKWTPNSREIRKYGVKSLDAILVSGDSLYKHINEMVGTMTFYDVKMIANETTGDTIVAVVDDKGQIRDKYAAFMQYVTLGSVALTLGSDIGNTISKARGLKKDWSQFFDKDNLEQSFTLSLTLGTAIKQMTRMSSAVTKGLVGNFLKQKKKIGTYIKASANVTDLSDPKLRNLPGVDLTPDDTLTKTEQEITEGLEQAKQEEGITKGGPDFDTMQKELDNLL